METGRGHPADIIRLSARGERRERAQALPQSAQILLFTGVRYEWPRALAEPGDSDVRAGTHETRRRRR